MRNEILIYKKKTDGYQCNDEDHLRHQSRIQWNQWQKDHHKVRTMRFVYGKREEQKKKNT